MSTKTMRKIIKIDEDKCNGCGACVPSCAEGAIKVIDGKAKLVSEVFCDGLGACLGECPQDALTIEEREAPEFDEKEVERHLSREREEQKLPCGCPSARVTQFEPAPAAARATATESSQLGQWPVQLTLVPPSAPFLKRADILLAADCVPFAYPAFHQEFLRGRALLIACPKLDDFPAHLAKLVEVLRQARPKSITVVHMEVPCCSGLTHMAQQAIRLSGVQVPLEDVTVGIRGQVKCACHG